MAKLIKKRYLFWFILSVLLSIFGPLFFRLNFLDGFRRIVILLGLIFGGFSLYSGFYFRRYGLKFWGIFIFPLTFSTINLLWRVLFGGSLVSRNYAYFFAAFYLVLSLFTFVSDADDSDSHNDMPIDGGFKEVK